MSDHIDGGITIPTRPKIIGGLAPKSGTLNGQLNAAGTRDYNQLVNKPKINGHELVGDKSFSDLGMRRVTSGEIIDILNM